MIIEEETDERKAAARTTWGKYLKGGVNVLSMDEIKQYSPDMPVGGGFLVPGGFMRTIKVNIAYWDLRADMEKHIEFCAARTYRRIQLWPFTWFTQRAWKAQCMAWAEEATPNE